ncbi:LTV1 [Candida oxycetoniae]|uniref:LTV1 n=1 Tax=Candida oxycetoniae TaxID=497107 RepID=A0AAI9T1P0_9ASCO|nr:LTV1 [Candida oxycetoniae]KAI3407009.2 LTV1 [Candida oxycetoniae]
MVKRFDKKNATTYSVVHRAHDDAKFYDEDASQNVLVPAAESQNQAKRASQNKKKVFTLNDLEHSLKEKVRDNEGMASQYGIMFDDSKYDYMQHLKPIGEATDAVFIPAKTKGENKSKQMSLEELLKEQLPSKEKRRDVTRDLNQSIPDELKGFQPDMDPRLREVLEALEDEAYIEEVKVGSQDDGDEEYDDDVFADLLKSGEVENEDEFYAQGEDDYDEWDLDNYEDEYNEKYEANLEEEEKGEEKRDCAGVNENWQRDFMKFKKETNNRTNEWDSSDEFEEDEEEDLMSEKDTIGDLPNIQSKKAKSKTKLRKKKGAMTDTSSFSMSSSALYRTEGLSLLDDRYEQLNKRYESEETKNNFEPKPFDTKEERTDFEDMLDDFLDNYELQSGGRRFAKKDEEKKKLQAAANSVSRGKRAMKLNKAFEQMKVE